MTGFMLPWEEPEIKRVIDIFGCKVISIEEVKKDEKLADQDTQK
jgi:hypothetical protein